MRYRPLGTTGLTVSEIGFGAWGIGGPSPGATSYGPTDDTVSLSTLERAFERGVTLYDTSNAYGNGHSEALIGQAFRERRTQVVIATSPSSGARTERPKARALPSCTRLRRVVRISGSSRSSAIGGLWSWNKST